jgi:hypothetical protein
MEQKCTHPFLIKLSSDFSTKGSNDASNCVMDLNGKLAGMRNQNSGGVKKYC